MDKSLLDKAHSETAVNGSLAIAQTGTDPKQHSDRTLDSCNSNTSVRVTSSLRGCHIFVELSTLEEAVLQAVHEMVRLQH